MTACPVCNARGLVPVRTIDEWTVKRCLVCGTASLDPMPSPERLKAYYDDFYEGASEGYFAKVDKKMARARSRVAALRSYIPTGRFLDVGCNGGFVVEAAREAGFAAVGVDLDKVSISYAQEHYGGSTFHVGRVQDLVGKEAPFDLLYSSEVIEHVPDPQGFATALAALAKPGAVLFITTPDMGHWTVPKDLAAWRGFMVPEHVLYFTASGLKDLMERAGFALIKRRWAFKPGIKMVFRRAAY
jgi:2-polyprenyl-3-methyl-5-hydroxy-6-metoxy-1,4-benzoquinol methylase